MAAPRRPGRDRRAPCAVVLVTALVGLVLSACGGDDHFIETRVRCEDQGHEKLRTVAGLAREAAIRRANRTAVREARRRGSAVARLLDGSGFRVGAGATVTFPAGAPSGAVNEQFGAIAELVLRTPHAAGPLVVPAYAVPAAHRGDAARAAPAGYLRFPGTLRAAVLRDLHVTVDLRTGAVIGVAPGRRSSGGVEPLPGDCRLVRERYED